MIGPDVLAIGRRAADAWRRHQPTRARLWSCGTEPEAIESFDPAWRATWREVVTGLEAEQRRLAGSAKCPADRAALAHLERFLAEEADTMWLDRLAALLDRVALLLLPIAATGAPLPPRVDGAAGWLTAFADRADAGDLVTVTAADRPAALAMAAGLEELGAAPDHPLVSALGRIAALAPRAGGGGPRPGLAIADLLARIECGAPAAVLSARLDQVIAGDIDRLNAIPPPLPGDAGDELPLPIARLELELAAIRELAADLGLAGHQGEAVVRAAPRALDRILSDALFLPGAALGAAQPDVLFLHRSYLAAPVRRAQLGGLKLILAHEICPGHAEHWAASRGSGGAELTALRRSPAGLEGWALEAERRIALAAGDPRLLESFLLHRLRRFIACRDLLARARREGAARSPAALFGQVRDPARARTLSAWVARTAQGGARNLVYAAGWLETDALLRSIPSVPAYLAVGPFSPVNAGALLGAS